MSDTELTRNQKIARAMKGKKNHLVHGHGAKPFSPTYVSWQAMLSRCRYKARDPEAKYVNRGIGVAEEWTSFPAFLADMGERPEGKTLERKNNALGYFRDNCEWATPVAQARNRRNAKLTFETAVQVAKARLSGESCPAIAIRFGCSDSLPREIVKGRTWKDALAQARKELYGE